jgi:regulator of replication initiation timing
LKKQNVEVFEELESVKGDLRTLMEINTAFGAENDKLKRKIKGNEGDSDESVAHLSKKVKSSTKGRKVIRISDDDTMDATEKYEEQAEQTEEPDTNSARVR